MGAISTLYQDEDMRSVAMPSTTLSAIMQQQTQSPFKYYKPSSNAAIAMNTSKGDQDEKVEAVTPKQLKHSRQDSYTNILPTPMHFQQMMDSKVPPMTRQQTVHESVDGDDDGDDEQNGADNRRKWRGFFNFFG